MSVIEKLDEVAGLIAEGHWTGSGHAWRLIRDHGPAIRQAMIDAERLADLEAHVAAHGGLVLHNGNIRGNYCGLGLANTGRTLRQAIDQMVCRATGEGEGHD